MHVPSIIGNNIVKLDAVNSTNTYAATLLKNQKPPEGLIIQAFHQTEGRGQMGTNWHSLAGESMTFSVILMPVFLKAHQQFYLNMAVSLGVYDYLAGKGVESILIKWPNDMLVQQKKIAGILIENSVKGEFLQHAIIGIGLNVNTAANHLPEFATSIFAETGNELLIDEEIQQIALHMDTYYTLLRLNKLERLKEAYMHKLLGHQQLASIRLNEVEMSVRVKDIQESGRIVLEEANGHYFEAGFKEFQWIY